MLASQRDGVISWAVILKKLLTSDYSTLFLLPIIPIAAAMAVSQWREERQVLFFVILTIITVPLILHVVGKFPIYYFWMVFLRSAFLELLS